MAESSVVRMFGRSLLLISLLSGPLTAQVYPTIYPPAPEGPFFLSATGHWYFRLAGLSGYLEGRDIAEAYGSYLVAISDANEQQWLLANFASSQADTFIGLNNAANPPNYAWDSGEPLTFVDWAPGQPTGFPPRFAQRIAGWVTTPEYFGSRAIVESEVPVVPSVPPLTCVPDPPNGILTWDASGFDTVRIYRSGLLLATVPASDQSFVDVATYGGGYVLIAENSVGTSLPARCNMTVPNTDYTLHIPDVIAPHPGPESIPILLDHTAGDLQGLSLGVCYDTASIDVIGAEEGSAVLAITPAGAAFFSFAMETGVGASIGMVFSLVPPLALLPPGTDQEIAVLSLEAAVAPPVSSTLQFCFEVGNPRVAVVVVVAGTSIIPLTVDGSITFVEPQFRRGDGNVDGAVDIADVLFLGLHLFDPTVNDYPCREACETNGDAQIDIADMVYTLSYLFISGPPPGAPFPDCGPDPEPETGFGCDAGANCP